MHSSITSPIVFLVGPTGVGKSSLALEVAKQVSGRIINADSVQCYRYTDIGTAKPSLQERQLRPHELFDFVEPPNELTAGQYRRLALHKILEAPQVPTMVVGGSGFYLQALEKGMYETPPTSKEIQDKLEQRRAQEGIESLYEELLQKDPPTAKKISINDEYRILRALGVFYTTGKTMSELRANHDTDLAKVFPLPLKKYGLWMSRDLLRVQVRQRFRMMMNAGFRQEVEHLLASGHGQWAPVKSVGYKEMIDVLEGRLLEHQLEDEVVKNTMRLAKRQMTWFRRDTEIQWFDASQDKDKLYRELVTLFTGHVSGE